MRPIAMRKNMRRGCSNLGLYRIFVVIAAMGLSASAGARTTIQTIAGHDSLVCQQFLAMVKAAGIPEMSDAQLCDFRFAQLPPSKTKHFTAIDWKPLDVKDPVAMYRHMRMANVRGYPSNDGPPWPNLIKAAAEAVADHNLGFSTAQVRLQGKGPEVTVVQMDVLRNCSKLPKYMLHVGVPYYAIYKGAGLKHPLRIWIPHESSQMMLWVNEGLKIPVLLTVIPNWVPPPNGYFNQITLNTLVLSRVKNGKYRDTVYDYGRCAYNLSSKTKPSGTRAISEEIKP